MFLYIFLLTTIFRDDPLPVDEEDVPGNISDIEEDFEDIVNNGII